jgi:hypothetical protein
MVAHSTITVAISRRDRAEFYPLERRSPYRVVRLAHRRWALPGGSPPRPGGGHPQARRSMARGGGDNEPDAMQTRRRAGLDHYDERKAQRASRRPAGNQSKPKVIATANGTPTSRRSLPQFSAPARRTPDRRVWLVRSAGEIALVLTDGASDNRARTRLRLQSTTL